MKHTLIFLLLLSFCSLQAQRNAPLRVELQTAKDADDYQSAQIGEKGVFVFYEGNMVNVDTTIWIFIRYDTNLHRQENLRVPLPDNINFQLSHFSGQHLYLLFQDKYQRKTTPKSYLLEICVEDNSTKLHTINELSDLNLEVLKVAGNNYIMLSYVKENYNIYIYNSEQDKLTKPELAPDYYIKSIEFCEIDTFQKMIYWGLVLAESAKSSVLSLIVTDFHGNVLTREIFPYYSGYYYNSARLSVIDATRSLIIGTFSAEKERGSGNLHTGVYTLTYKNNKMGDPNYYNFSHIKNKDSIADSKHRNRGGNLNVLVGDIFQQNGQFSLVNEIFYPEYSYTSTSSMMDPYYYGYNSTPTSSFVGYRYVNAYVTTFDQEGKLLWDLYVPFTNILTQRLLTRVAVFNFEDYAVVYYPYNASLTYTMLKGYEIIEPLSSANMPTFHKDEIVEYSRNPRFEKWHGNYFLNSGYQYIRGGREGKKARRYVFFLSKMEYR